MGQATRSEAGGKERGRQQGARKATATGRELGGGGVAMFGNEVHDMFVTWTRDRKPTRFSFLNISPAGKTASRFSDLSSVAAMRMVGCKNSAPSGAAM